MKIGKVSENVVKRSVLKNIEKNHGAATGVDCAIFTGYIANEEAESCGGHALIRACNNAVVCGKRPKYASVSITLPEKMREVKLKQIVKDIDYTASTLGIIILDGHTETVEDIKYPIITVTVVANEPLCDEKEWVKTKPKPGQSIVMTKWIAMSGSAKLARRYKNVIMERYPEFIITGAEELDQFYSILPEAAVAIRSGAICMNDCSDGGIFAALWQLGDINGVGLEVNLKDIPIWQEEIEVCEFFDINPYKLRSDGALLIVTDTPEEMIKNLADNDIFATCIGHITDGIDRIIVSGDDRRFLEEPRQDEEYMIKL